MVELFIRRNEMYMYCVVLYYIVLWCVDVNVMHIYNNIYDLFKIISNKKKGETVKHKKLCK